MRAVWILCVICSILFSDEEALFLRRIAAVWEEGEYQLAKRQMEQFIAEYPESPYSDALSAALGDLFLREKNFLNALNYYAQIQTPEFKAKVFLNRMQCLYEMQWYATLADECGTYLENGEDLHVTYFLAIALYHQCLNASKEQLIRLAERAKPYFEILSQSELSGEIAQGYAHLCCVLKDFPKAAEIYLGLAEKEGEEMLFQAALIQSEYDKELALKTFDKIVSLGQKKAPDAAYNRLVLAFDLGHFEELTQENILNQIPPERVGMARLFLGRSLLNLRQYEPAVNELQSIIEETPISEALHVALLSLFDASYNSGQLASLDKAIAKFATHYPQDPELPKAYFSRAQILKKNQQYAEAREQLERILIQFPQMEQKAQVLFELTHLEYKAKVWDGCYKKAKTFLAEFPEHELAPFAWRYWISSSVEMGGDKVVADLQTFLKQPMTDTEKGEWTLVLAKTYYSLHDYEKAEALLQNVTNPNARLLKALCYLDGQGHLELFCEEAESAISEGANLIDVSQIHTSLFNAYLELSEFEKAAEHLYTAFQAKIEIKRENLLWLADLYLERLQEEQNFALAHRVVLILDKCKAALHDEPVLCKLAKAYSILGRTDDAIAILQPLSSPMAELLLAENYAKKGIVEKAVKIFDAIVSSDMRTPLSASASLQVARLKLAGENPDLVQIATQLKSLVVQKTFDGEPIYLEAALDYVDVQSKTDMAKRVTLLQKTKLDFERRDDLLSKDYHEARIRQPRKDKIYQGYLQLIDAEILAAQAQLDGKNRKELKEKSKNLLKQIMNEQSATALLQRARMLLTNVDGLEK